MSRIKLEIGCAPHEEDVAQVGDPDYGAKSSLECRAFIGQILRAYPEAKSFIESDVMDIRIKSFPHDFGSYKEVVLSVDDSNEAAVDLAFEIEGDARGMLAKWDVEAQRGLAAHKEDAVRGPGLYESLFGENELTEATNHISPNGESEVSEYVLDEIDALKEIHPDLSDQLDKLKRKKEVVETDDLADGVEMMLYNLGKSGVSELGAEMKKIAELLGVDHNKALMVGFSDYNK